MSVRAQKHRLPEREYFGRKSVSFTICERNRRPLLADQIVVDCMIDLLGVAAERCGCTVPLYCFMPDHAHFVISGTTDDSRPKEALDRFKKLSGRWFSKERPDIAWQRGYFDRIIRNTEDWQGHLRYIAPNPVRAGLVADMSAWPFSGAIGHDVRDVLDGAFW